MPIAPRLASPAALALLTVALAPASLAWQGADDCANAQPITGLGPHAFDNTNATATPGLSDCNGVGVRKDIWYSWTAANDARVTLQVCGQTTLEMRLAVYAGDCNNLDLLSCGTDGCPADSNIRFEAEMGQSYLFRIGSRSVGESGTGTFTLTESIPIFNAANGSYYEVVNENLSWSQARDAAEQLTWKGRTGHLVIYNDFLEQDFIVQNANAGRAWTGLYQELTDPNYSEPDGGWIWIDGSSAVAPQWAANEPNNAGANGEDFAETFGGGIFNDVADGHLPTDQYIVEWDSPFGTNYCQANPNSTGQTASMSVAGSPKATLNDVTLSSAGLPANAFSFYITSPVQGFVANPAGSAGNLCLGGAIGRYVGPGQIQQAGASGEISLGIDLTAIPTPNGPIAVVAGDTHNFQAWYRDAIGGTPTSNFTDGVSILFE